MVNKAYIKKMYKKDCLHYEDRTCRQQDNVYHCIYKCPNDCKRYTLNEQQSDKEKQGEQ